MSFPELGLTHAQEICQWLMAMRVNTIKSYLVWFCNLAFTPAGEILFIWFLFFDFCIFGFGFPILKLDSQTICLKNQNHKNIFWKSRIFPNSTRFVSIIFESFWISTVRTNQIDMKDFLLEISLVNHSRHGTSVWYNFKMNALGTFFLAYNGTRSWLVNVKEWLIATKTN